MVIIITISYIISYDARHEKLEYFEKLLTLKLTNLNYFSLRRFGLSLLNAMHSREIELSKFGIRSFGEFEQITKSRKLTFELLLKPVRLFELVFTVLVNSKN